MNNTLSIPTEVKLSKNYSINEFLNSFLYHNYEFFSKSHKLGIGDWNDTSLDNFKVGIHYECGPWKWGSVGLMNKMVKKGFVTIIKDHNNNCYCLDATPKLKNKIMKAVNNYMSNC